MPLISAGAFVADAWSRPAPGETAARIIVPWERFMAERDALLAANLALGVEVPNTAQVAALAPHLARLALIAIQFPKFQDGRGFTLARRLRLAGFAGELRAVGHLIPDQAELAAACGIDTIEITPEAAQRQPEPQWRAAYIAFSLGYVPTALRPTSILQMRHGA